MGIPGKATGEDCGEADEVRIPTEFPLGRQWLRRGLPRTAGGPGATWGAGGGVSPWLLPGPAGSSGLRAEAPTVPAPPQPRRRGTGRCSKESAFAAVAGSSVTRLPVQRIVAFSPWSLASVLSVWEQEHLGAHRALPPPLLRPAPSLANGCGLAKVTGKARPLRPAPPPESRSPARCAPLTMLAPLRTPRAQQLPGADLSLPSEALAPAQTASRAGEAGRRAPGKRGRAGGRRSRIGEGGTRSAALTRLPQRRRKNPA